MKKYLFVMLCVLCVSTLAIAQEVQVNSEVTSPVSVAVTEAAAPVVKETPKQFNIVDIFKAIPTLKQGIAYSVLDSRINYLTTMDLFNYKGVNLEGGYAGNSAKTAHKAIILVSYDLWDAKRAGVSMPILDLVKFRPGVYVAAGRIGSGTSEYDAGISATFIDVKF